VFSSSESKARCAARLSTLHGKCNWLKQDGHAHVTLYVCQWCTCNTLTFSSYSWSQAQGHASMLQQTSSEAPGYVNSSCTVRWAGAVVAQSVWRLYYSLDSWGTIPTRDNDVLLLLFTTASRPALGPTQPRIQWVPGGGGALSLGWSCPLNSILFWG
jgi:hypothetical protein